MDIGKLAALRPGDIVLLETEQEVLVGTLQFADLARGMLAIEHARDINTNYKYTCSQILPLQHIKAIKMIDEDEDEDRGCAAASTRAKEELSSIEAGSRGDGELPTMKLKCSNFQQIDEQLNSLKYIVQVDSSYHKALQDIRAQEVVGLHIEPCAYGRHRQITVLCIATHRTLYIFDMTALGRIFREFKEILEAKKPIKAVHYSHKVLDHMVHRQHVHLGGIFDTFVAHCLVRGAKEPLSLIEAVQNTLNVPQVYFKYTSDRNMNFDAFRRPLTRADLQFVGKRAVFVLKLYHHILHDNMLANFYKQCEAFSRTFSDNVDSVDVATKMTPKTEQGFQHIECGNDWRASLDAQFP